MERWLGLGVAIGASLAACTWDWACCSCCWASCCAFLAASRSADSACSLCCDSFSCTHHGKSQPMWQQGKCTRWVLRCGGTGEDVKDMGSIPKA